MQSLFSIDGLSSYTIAVAALAVTLAGALLILPRGWFAQRPPNFPSGPPCAPILGNLHQVPTTKSFLRFHEWGKTYGDIIGLKFGSQNVVVLNNYRLFDKRGGIYSSRPPNYIGQQLICPNDVHGLLMQYSPEYTKLRKTMNSFLVAKSVDALLPLQNAEANLALHQLSHDPGGYYDHIRRYTNSVIVASVIGLRSDRFDSSFTQALYHAQDQFTAILEPGATPPVDFFPFLQWVPERLASWKRWAKRVRKEQRQLYFHLLNETRRLVKEQNVDSFMARILKEEKTGYDEEHLAYLGGPLIEAGSDTTASTILSLILAMCKHPEVLKKAQQEVDAICGVHRSPTPEDVGQFPYVEACIAEVLRWRPVAAGGIPHALTRDDTYEGYFFPKGTIFFANAWSIHRDVRIYDDPDEFIPERFLNNKYGTKNGVIDADDTRRRTYAFGAGRRVCTGQHFAENSLSVAVPKLIWAFNVSHPSAPEKVNVEVEGAYTAGFLTAPRRFPVDIEVRSEEHRSVIEKEGLEAMSWLNARYEGV